MGEGEPRADLGPPTIKIFISGNSGSKEITNNQHRILMILKSLGMLVEVVDISAPGMDEQRDLMRASAKEKEEKKPQEEGEEKKEGEAAGEAPAEAPVAEAPAAAPAEASETPTEAAPSE